MTYWQQRAKAYNNLAWVRDRRFMASIIAAGNFRKSDIVLDAGAGTGVVAKALVPLVQGVIALDSSPHMMKVSADHQHNIKWVTGDLRSLEFADNIFDAIVARYVFHHIIDDTEKAMTECYRVLRHGGVMVFAEGVPPSQRTKQDFVEIFKLKEKRITFMRDDMIKLMTSAGFIICRKKSLRLKQMSVRNWIESGGTPESAKEAIFLMHRNAPDYFKQDYKMTLTGNDCLIDMKVEVLTGIKH